MAYLNRIQIIGTASPTSTQMPQYNPRSPAPTESAADEDDGLPF